MVARDLEDLSGQQIGNYEIETHIAARKASDLFLARDVKLERLVFLEVLRVTEDEDQDLAERFHGRMETASQLKDPRIAVVSDLDVTDDGFPYAVIDYFPGETLADKLADMRHNGQTLPVIESLELVKQIAQGLGVAHAAGLIHHDLRPENIMLRQDGAPVLIDLGVPTVPGTATPGLNGNDSEVLDYAAPEEAEGKPLTRRSNLYSLGVILYELLAGHQPRLPTLPFDIFPQANMPKEEPLEEARPGLAGETYRLVRNCLWRQEWSRFETAEEMITAIETAIFAEQELPKAAAWAPRRGRSPAIIIIPIAVLLVGVLGFFLVRGLFGGNGGSDDPTREGTPVGTFVAAADTADPNATPSPTTTRELPTESSGDLSISVLSPGANREFSPQETINFDWLWVTLPDEGQHFAVYLLANDEETLLGTLTEPNYGANYRLSVPVKDIPATGGVAWQIRLESVDGGDVIVASDPRPMVIRAEATATATTPTNTIPAATDTPEPTSDCTVDPPPGWVRFTIRQGDALSALAAAANIPVETLLEVNCLANDLISVGQQVWVPQGALPRTPTSPPPTPTNPPPPPPPTATQPSVSTEPPPPTSGPGPVTPTEPPPTDPPPSATAPPPATEVPP